MNVNEIINKSTQTTVNNALKTAGFDKTRTGQIISVNDNNTYSVRIDGVVYPNVSVYGGGDFVVNDFVKVVYPCNNTSQMFISGNNVTFTEGQNIDITRNNNGEYTISTTKDLTATNIIASGTTTLIEDVTIQADELIDDATLEAAWTAAFGS